MLTNRNTGSVGASKRPQTGQEVRPITDNTRIESSSSQLSNTSVSVADQNYSFDNF